MVEPVKTTKALHAPVRQCFRGKPHRLCQNWEKRCPSASTSGSHRTIAGLPKDGHLGEGARRTPHFTSVRDKKRGTSSGRTPRTEGIEARQPRSSAGAGALVRHPSGADRQTCTCKEQKQLVTPNLHRVTRLRLPLCAKAHPLSCTPSGAHV